MVEQFADYDSPWKDMLERYFQECLEFFFPQVYRGIDWSYGVQFLDKELQQVVRDAEQGRRIVDKLVSVKRKRGKETWVLVHIEVQGQPEEEFEKRMYVYHYRLFDRYDRSVCSLAVLVDEQKNWRPRRFRKSLWGCTASLTFPVVKLLDYRGREHELETSLNPFALVVLAYLKTLETKKIPEQRFHWKFQLYTMLYARGYSREDILELMRCIDWMMVLPEALQQRFETAITEYEEEHKMQYVTSHERLGFERGAQQGLQQGLQQGRIQGGIETSREAILDILYTRFEVVPHPIERAIQSLEGASLFKRLLHKAVTIESLQAFQEALTHVKTLTSSDDRVS